MGLEEEVFITEPTLPSLGALWHLARLLWSNPSYYYAHSASNFARGRDLRQSIMSGVEISTGIHSGPDDLVKEASLLSCWLCMFERRMEGDNGFGVE